MAASILGIAMVKNEQDIIESFVRHNLLYLDTLIIADNNSDDNTRSILAKLMEELDGIVLTDISGLGFFQQERLTNLLHYAQTAYFADFVVFLDADEFVLARSRDTFESELSLIPRGGYGLLAWQTYVLTQETLYSAEIDPPRSFRARRLLENPAYFKAVLHAAGQPCLDLIVSQGSHCLLSARGSEVPHLFLSDAKLGHFPVRSRAQIVTKSIIGWMAMRARDPNWDGASYQWKAVFDQFVSGGAAIGDRSLCKISMEYAQNPASEGWQTNTVEDIPKIIYHRDHSTGAFFNPLVLVARSWERSTATKASFIPTVNNDSYISPGVSSHRSTAELFLDIPPLKWLAEKYRLSSVLGLGCGVGGDLEAFRMCGVSRQVGVDTHERGATWLSGQQYVQASPFEDVDLQEEFDLVSCIEVASTADDEYAHILLQNANRHAKHKILFSSAGPGQPGLGHVNLLPISEWLSRWWLLGWAPDIEGTLAVRALATFSWLRRNCVVLTRKLEDQSDQGIKRLEEVSQRKFIWYAQAPGIREEICGEALPIYAGYGN